MAAMSVRYALGPHGSQAPFAYGLFPGVVVGTILLVSLHLVSTDHPAILTTLRTTLSCPSVNALRDRLGKQ